MSRGFGSTLGAGTTDVVQSAFGTSATQRSYAIWTNRHGAGGSSGGRLWDKRNNGGTSEIAFFNSNANSQYRFNPVWTTGAQFSIPFPVVDTWHHVLAVYDSGSTANVPVIYLDGISQTVTTQVAATGTYGANSETFGIGNTSGIRVWDGMLAEFAVWNRLLTQAEATALAAGKAPSFFATSLVEYIQLGTDVTSKINSAPTVTGTLATAGPAINYAPTRLGGPYGLEYGMGYQSALD